MKKFYSLLALLMFTCITTSAQETWLVDGSEYFFQNVASDYWLGGGNSWGTQVSVINQPQNFKAVKVSEGVYKFDSHQYNGANAHFLDTGYLDGNGCNWSVIAVGDGTYYLKSADNKYASLGENPGAPAAFLDAPTDNSKWRIYSYDAVAARMETATAENPVKITELIEANTLKRNTVTQWYKPWTITGFNGSGTPSNYSLGQNGNNAHCAESYHSSNGFKFTQTVDTCILPGIYKFEAQAFYRQDGGDVENMPYYSVNGEKSYFPLKTGTENNMVEAYTSFLAKTYPIAPIFFAIGEEDAKKIEIEIANKNTTMWNIFGELELSYLGNSPEACQAWLDGFIAAKPDYSAIEYKTGDVYSEYEFALQDHSTASSVQEAREAIAAINEAEVALKANIAAWNALIEARDQAVNNVVNNEKIVGPDKEALGDYITGTINNQVLSEKSASNEELAAYTAEIKRLEEIAVENGMEAGTDVTYMLKNPNMTENGGWEGNPTINTGAKCAERWNGGAFDVYQVVEGAPVGIYQITLQGFYRPARGEQSYKFYFNEDGSRKETPDFGTWKENKAYIYMNDAQTLLDVVWNYGQKRDNLTYDLTERANKPYEAVVGTDTTWYCNDMGDAGKAFDQGAYQVSAYGLVGEKGDVMRLGVKGDNFGLDNWAIFTRFKLTYQRFAPAILKDFLSSEITKAEASLPELFGYDKRQALTQTIADSKAVVEGDDGDAMFAALKALVAAEKDLTASIAKFDTLMTKMEDLDVALSNYEATATEEAKAEAGEFLDNVLNPALPPEKTAESVTITDEQAVQYIKKIDELIAALKIPARPGSDEAPEDYTSMINNNDYSTKSGEGWTMTNVEGNNNYNHNAAEYYQGVYNHYQDIKNLPAGTYMVSNQGFYRWTSQQEDFDSVRAEVPSLASMYVMTFTENSDAPADSIACPIRHLSADAINANPDITGQTSTALFGKEYDDTPWYVPNNMESFSNWVKSNKESYQNKIIVKVAEGETLRIGMSQEKSVGGGWAIFTNWTMTAYGPESTKEEGVLTSSYADYTPAIDSERAAVRKPLHDVIEEADKVYESMEEGEAKEELGLAIKSAKEVYDANTSSNDDVVAATNALREAIGTKKGDVNRDGLINSSDVVRDYEYMSGQTEGVTMEDADVNSDGAVNSSDIVRIYEIMSGN